MDAQLHWGYSTKSLKTNTLEIGIIAEGKGDCAVLTNILMGVLDLDEEDIRYLRPEFNKQFQKLKQKSEFEKSDFLSKGFRRLSTKKGKKVIDNNESLAAFVVSLEKLEQKN